MTIADKLTLLASSKEALRVKLGLPENLPFSEYYKHSYPFDPMTLFAGGKQGVWYDPSDKSTLFQNVGGASLPVTKDGDPVGLMLDKSQGLEGAVTNVAKPFMDDVSDDYLEVTNTSDGTKLVLKQGSNRSTLDIFEVDKTYKLSIVYSIPETADNINVHNTRSGGSNFLFTATKGVRNKAEVTLTARSATLYFRSGSGEITVHEIVLKEIKGNHASQSVSTSRPVYKTDGILHWLEPDGVDDMLYTGNFNLGEYDGVSSWIGIREEREGDNIELLSFSESAFSIIYSYALRKTPFAYKTILRGSTAQSSPPYLTRNAVEGSNAVVSTTVSTLQGNYSIARNNDPKNKTSITVGTLAPLGNHPLYIAGRPAGFNTKSRIYGIVISGEKDEVTEAKVLQYLSSKSGVTL